MIDVEFELKKKVIAVMRADPDLSALVGVRINDEQPQSVGGSLPVSPYIFLGQWTATDQSAGCIDGMNVQIVIDCYSHGQSGGTGEHLSSALVSKVAARVRRALVTDEFELSDDVSAAISHRVTRYFNEDDGTLQRASVNLEATVDEFHD